jgi:hypothetical protein
MTVIVTTVDPLPFVAVIVKVPLLLGAVHVAPPAPVAESVPPEVAQEVTPLIAVNTWTSLPRLANGPAGVSTGAGIDLGNEISHR